MPVTRQVAIADNGPAIQDAVRDSLKTADLIITTGGLGPTSDDVTRELIADLLGLKLEMDADVLRDIEAFFQLRGRPAPESSKVQALVPNSGWALRNAHGTAPGLVVPLNSGGNTKYLVMLPGPPRELKPMFREQVVPLLQQKFNVPELHCRTFKTTGLGESLVEERIAARLQPLVNAGLEIGYCARVGEVEVRITCSLDNARQQMDAAETIIREQLGVHLFASDERSLDAIVVAELNARSQTLSLAESCTGGLIANRITNIPGASAVFMAGLVTYSNEAKQRLLGVKVGTLDQYGAVSAETAREMAEGARLTNRTDYAIAVTGIAGPGGGTTQKPVGTVFVALATPDKTIVEKQFNAYDRETFKFLTSQQALDLLRRNLVQS